MSKGLIFYVHHAEEFQGMGYHRLFDRTTRAVSWFRANSVQNVKITEVHHWDLSTSISELISTRLCFSPWSPEPESYTTAPPSELSSPRVGHDTPSHLKDPFLRVQ